jgi:heme exporter protein C
MQSKPRLLFILDILSGVLIILATLMVLFYAPVEAIMGAVQKVFYFHVASAWLGMLGFLVASVAGVIYLRNKRQIWDMISASAVELGMVFSFIAIVSGMIWARPIWNTWWTWDPRLTTMTIMELLYVAYLMLRSAVEDPERRARLGAIYVIVAFISVPLTFFSIRFARTIHPVVIGSSDPTSQGAFDMTARMLQTFITSLVVFTVLFADLLWNRVRLEILAQKVDQIKAKIIN